jgi:hypothetical protein
MIKDLDASLQNMLLGEAPPGSELATATVSFAAPDATWRGQGVGLAVNSYLYQLHEDRELRSNERIRLPQPDGQVQIQPSPGRVQCCYAITAWDKAEEPQGVEKERIEHRLLSQVLYVLLRNPVLPAAYLTGLLATSLFERPVICAEPDGAGGTGDFWSALGTYLKPAVSCKVTLAIDLQRAWNATMVTSLDVRLQGGDERFQIAGRVLDSGHPPQAVPAALVSLAETGASYIADDEGRFAIAGLAAGQYTITAQAVGFKTGQRSVRVPAPDGSYDLNLSPSH